MWERSGQIAYELFTREKRRGGNGVLKIPEVVYKIKRGEKGGEAKKWPKMKAFCLDFEVDSPKDYKGEGERGWTLGARYGLMIEVELVTRKRDVCFGKWMELKVKFEGEGNGYVIISYFYYAVWYSYVVQESTN